MADATGSSPDPEELEHLEALEEAEAGARVIGSEDPGEPMRIVAHRLLAGAPAPAFNPGAHKEYYRFLFAGVLVFVGCLMPFGPQPQPGYYSITGGFMLVIATGLIWSMWGAINTGLFRMKWVLLMLFPFVWSLMHLINAFGEPAVSQWIVSTPDTKHIESWPEFFRTLVARSDPERFPKLSEFMKTLGPGKIPIFLGSLLAEIYFILAIFGGIKRASQKKADRRAAPRTR